MRHIESDNVGRLIGLGPATTVVIGKGCLVVDDAGGAIGHSDLEGEEAGDADPNVGDRCTDRASAEGITNPGRIAAAVIAQVPAHAPVGAVGDIRHPGWNHVLNPDVGCRVIAGVEVGQSVGVRGHRRARGHTLRLGHADDALIADQNCFEVVGSQCGRERTGRSDTHLGVRAGERRAGDGAHNHEVEHAAGHQGSGPVNIRRTRWQPGPTRIGIDVDIEQIEVCDDRTDGQGEGIRTVAEVGQRLREHHLGADGTEFGLRLLQQQRRDLLHGGQDRVRGHLPLDARGIGIRGGRLVADLRAGRRSRSAGKDRC